MTAPIPQTLEDQLETALLEDFNVLIEDGSTAEVSLCRLPSVQ